MEEEEPLEAISKSAFLTACRCGDLALIQQYVAQPDVARLVLALERALNPGPTPCNVREASRTMMAASRGLWFSGSHSEGGDAFRVVIVNQQTEVLKWFFTSQFARTIPTTLQVVFVRLASQVVIRANWEVVEMLLDSWVFRVAMEPSTQQWILSTIYRDAFSLGLPVDLVIAHGAHETLDDYCC